MTAPSVTAATPLKMHVALNVADIERSIHFYRAFFGVGPTKHKPDYAKFEVADPPLNFTLNRGDVDHPGALNHLGIQVRSSEQVWAARDRLQKTGLVTLSEKDTDCCYALQDKIWVQDPDGYRWEVFVVKVADTAPEADVEAADLACC